MNSFSLLNWNVRGLNDRARRCGVHSLVNQTRCSLLCLQETKHERFSDAMIAEMVGARLTGSALLPVVGTRGGVLLAWDANLFDVSTLDISAFAISVIVQPRTWEAAWTLTTVYGPADEGLKQLFLDDLHRIRGMVAGAWLLIGDFNLIYEARDKNNGNVNHRLMAQFRDALQSSDLLEIKLSGRKFTWSNEQQTPTLVRLDRAFCSPEWDAMFSAARLQPLATAMSDHCPLLLTCDTATPRRPRFRFEAFWPHIECFQDVVLQAWSQPCRATGAVKILDEKFRRTARALRLWHKNYIGDTKLQLLMAQDTVTLPDAAQESRQLEPDELQLWKDLKSRILGLAVIERIKARQRARVKWIRVGDANTKFFHIKANARRRKNFIVTLAADGVIATEQKHKEEIAANFFRGLQGTAVGTAYTFN